MPGRSNMEEEGFTCSCGFSMSWQEMPDGGNGSTGGHVTRAAHTLADQKSQRSGRGQGRQNIQGSTPGDPFLPISPHGSSLPNTTTAGDHWETRSPWETFPNHDTTCLLTNFCWLNGVVPLPCSCGFPLKCVHS